MAPQRKTRGAIQSDISLRAVKKREEIYITTKLLAWELVVLLAIDSCRRLILSFEVVIMLLQWPWENQVFSWAIFFETSSTVSSVSMIESSWKSVEDPWYHQFILDIKNEIFTSNKEVNILAVFAQKKTPVHVFNDEEIMHWCGLLTSLTCFDFSPIHLEALMLSLFSKLLALKPGWFTPSVTEACAGLSPAFPSPCVLPITLSLIQDTRIISFK